MPWLEAFFKEMETVLKISRPLGAGSHLLTLLGVLQSSLPPGIIDYYAQVIPGFKGFEEKCDLQHCTSKELLLK